MQSLFAEKRKLVDDRIYTRLSPDFEKLEAKEVIKYMFRIGGKRLRPILLLMCNRALGGQEEKAMDGAASVELIHAASLIFDDILDKDKTRRRFLTTHIMFSDEEAISTGLFLASKGVQILSEYREERVMRMISDALVDISKGEVLDVLFRDNLNLENYISIANMKTASLFSASAGIGGILAGGKEDEIDAFLNFGRLIGIAFQIQDDILDLAGGDKESPLKGLNLSTLNGPMKPPLGLIGQNPAINDTVLARGDNPIDYAQGLSRGYVNKAKRELDSLNPRNEVLPLRELADFILTRKE